MKTWPFYVWVRRRFTSAMIMPRALYDEMIAILRDALPEEACGLISGRGDQAHGLYPVENQLHSRVAYEMAPLAQVEAMLAIEGEGLDLVGIFHSHPTGPAAPSTSDLTQSYYPDAQYVIVSFQVENEPVARSFYLSGDMIREVEFTVI